MPSRKLISRSPSSGNRSFGALKQAAPVTSRFVLFIIGLVASVLVYLQIRLVMAVQARNKQFAQQQDKQQLSGVRPPASLLAEPASSCAINLFGLPRAFRTMVLPSMEQFVIPFNPHCDYFVHAYNLTFETPGRSGAGGPVRPDEIWLLREAVHRVNPHAHVEFVLDPEERFWKLYEPLLQRIRKTVDDQGRPLYFPWKARTYVKYVTVENIVKMWHSILKVWELMNQHMRETSKKYSRVGMLRSDVLYVTPINIWELEKGHTDAENAVTVLPAFARYPVSDRIAYGPYEAVRVWATNRFVRLKQHVQWVLRNDPGWGMHSERFINFTVLPEIRQLPPAGKYRVMERKDLCFLRARADESVWFTDCTHANPAVADPQVHQLAFGTKQPERVVEEILGRPCRPETVKAENKFTRSIRCPSLDTKY